jgi:DUF177 domain-containing protein
MRPAYPVEAVGTLGYMTTVDLRSIRIRSGEQWRGAREVELDPFELGGERYVVHPRRADAELAVSRTTSGLVFDLAFSARLVGPCFRCLVETTVETPIRAQEYHSSSPDAAEELRTPYVVENHLALSAWARDAVALALPDKILCRPDCAGLCPTCGRDLNAEPHEHVEEALDPRWAALASLRDRL